MNIFLLVFLGILVLEVGICTLQKYFYLPYLGEEQFKYFYHIYLCNNFLTEGADYIPLESQKKIFTDLASFMVIFNYIIPISLYVTLGLLSRFRTVTILIN